MTNYFTPKQLRIMSIPYCIGQLLLGIWVGNFTNEQGLKVIFLVVLIFSMGGTWWFFKEAKDIEVEQQK